MNRLGFAPVFVAAGLAWAALEGSPVLAAGQEKPDAPAPGRDDEGPGKRIDKAIQAYENRADRELEQTRTDIARLQKELTEIVELQFGLVINVAELQAELKVQQMAAAQGGDAPDSPSSSSKNDDDRRRQRAVELNRELRAVLENLRGVVTQKRNETDQLIIQLRTLRAQQRQMDADAERAKQPVKPSQD
jgi:hypothetical protein